MTIVDLPSPNHGPRAADAPVRFLILHYTGMVDGATALARLTDPASQVSAHYTIDEDGTVYAHVAEDRRAWHAGVSAWAGLGDINSRSIGVEIVNPGHEFGYRSFPPAQMTAVAVLCRGIVARWSIAAADVLGHSDIAPARKQDPGELFDWAWLAGQGVGLWPTPTLEDEVNAAAAVVVDDNELPALLARFGYDPAAPADLTLTAFQRHYQPDRVGEAANRTTLARLRALLRLTGR